MYYEKCILYENHFKFVVNVSNGTAINIQHEQIYKNGNIVAVQPIKGAGEAERKRDAKHLKNYAVVIVV